MKNKHYLTPQERRERIRERQATTETHYARQAQVAGRGPKPKPLTLFNLLGDAILQLTFENLQLRRIGRHIHKK